MKKNWQIILILFLVVSACSTPLKSRKSQVIETQKSTNIEMASTDSDRLKGLLQQYPAYFENLINDPEKRVQVIYTEINRAKDGSVTTIDHYLNVQDSLYFYPASTVKLPVAALALQKLNELQIKGLDKNSTMITEAAYSGQTEVYNDPNSPDGRPTLANYIKKILLVSDNDAYNRLYEFLGQEYINNTLHKMGYEEVQIIHRLEISLTEDENRHTNPVRFLDTSGKLIYEKPLEESKLVYAKRNTRLGNGYYRGGELINEPFNFSMKNRMSLQTLNNIVKCILFPESVSEKQRFNLSKEDYEFLRKYMSMTPLESKAPAYDSVTYWDNYVKFLFYGAEKILPKDGIRIFNKPGDAYGFLIDAAYMVDFKNDIEFLVSAIIYCNSDGVLNDNKYDYDEVGLPFMKHLGQVIYDHELKRKRQFKPGLNNFKYDYSQ